MLTIATKEFIGEIDALAEKRRQEILNTPDKVEIKGTKYYVSNAGDDSNDGLTPETAWKTLEKVSSAKLDAGDGVLFKRGDLFRGFVIAQKGVTYAAYGQGEKPKFYGWERSLDDADLWELVDAEHNIWKWGEKILDCGTLVFNEGEAHCIKLIPSYINGKFVCREDESKDFVMANEMVRDLDMYWHFEDTLTTNPSRGQDFPIPDPTNGLGDLYLRCDKGNPAKVFKTIEGVVKRNMFCIASNNNITIDNVCIKYIGQHAIGGGGQCLKGLTVTNCEIGWIGGSIQHYYGTDPNYLQGGRGTVTRFGNAIEIYGGCDDYLAENNYIYQVYDAGITHQISTFGRHFELTNVLYKNNLVEYCVYGIEYFLDMSNGDVDSFMDNIEMCGNIIRHSGFGWGQQRHNTHTPAHIKGWSYVNVARNYTVHDNVFDRAGYRMLHLVAQKDEYCPEMHDNTYVQYEGGMLGQWGGNENGEPEIEIFDDKADEKVANIFHDKNAKVYIIKK